MHDMFGASIDVVHSDLFMAVRVYPAARTVSRSWLEEAPGRACIWERENIAGWDMRFVLCRNSQTASYKWVAYIPSDIHRRLFRNWTLKILLIFGNRASLYRVSRSVVFQTCGSSKINGTYNRQKYMLHILIVNLALGYHRSKCRIIFRDCIVITSVQLNLKPLHYDTLHDAFV